MQLICNLLERSYLEGNYFWSFFFNHSEIVTNATAYFFSSERVRAIFGFFLFYFFNDFFKFKEKIFSILFLILIFVFLFNTSNFLKLRFSGQFFKPIISVFQVNNESNKQNKFKDNLYIRLYQSGFEVFKKYPVF